MAGNEREITTVFKADISNFSSSTQELNRYIKTVNSEFKSATSSMGDWSKNTDGLQAKITSLNKIMDAEKKKLSLLQKEYEGMTDEQKKNSKAGQDLYVKIKNQEAVVGKTKAGIDKYTKALDDLKKESEQATKSTKDLNSATEKTGSNASGLASKLGGGLAKGLAGITTACVGAVGGFLALAESTRETRTQLNQIETSFTEAGFSAEQSTETYNELFGVLGDSGKATEASLHMAQLAKSEEDLSNWTTIATGVYSRFGDSLPIENLMEASNETAKTGKLTGGLTDALNWAGVSEDEFQAKLDACTTEQERQALITDTLNGLYEESAEAYKENNKEVIEAQKAQQNLTNAIAKLGEIAEPIMTALKNAFAGFLTSITPFVELIGNGLTGAFSGASDGASKFAEGISGLVTTALDRLTEMLPTVLGIVLELIPSIATALLGALPSVIETLSSMISQIVVALGDLLPQVVQAIIDALPLVVQAIADSLPQILSSLTTLMVSIVEALPSLVESLIASVGDIIVTIIDLLPTFIPQLIQSAITLLMAIVDAIPQVINALLPQVPTIVNSIITSLISMIPQMIQASITLLMGIIKAIPTIIRTLVTELPKIISTIVNTLTQNLPLVIQGAITLFMGIVQAIPTIIIELVKQLPTIITSIVGGLMEGVGEMNNVGVELIKGLWEGIKSMSDWLWDKVKEFGGKVTGWFKKVFKIKSPSKVFADTIGKNLALGIGEGFDDNIDSVEKDMAKSMRGIDATIGVDQSKLSSVNAFGSSSMFNGLAEQIASLINNAKNSVNNYSFNYKFEKMESSRLALHKAQLETKRLIGG